MLKLCTTGHTLFFYKILLQNQPEVKDSSQDYQDTTSGLKNYNAGCEARITHTHTPWWPLSSATLDPILILQQPCFGGMENILPRKQQTLAWHHKFLSWRSDPTLSKSMMKCRLHSRMEPSHILQNWPTICKDGPSERKPRNLPTIKLRNVASRRGTNWEAAGRTSLELWRVY